MNSCIYLDIGNSYAKWKFENEYFAIPTDQFNIEKLPSSLKIWASNVSSNAAIKRKSNIKLVKSQKRYKSLTNSYKESSLLGSDRWLGMIASYELSEEKSFVLVDIGTAVTIDIVNNSGKHLGGLIFPGLNKIRKTFDNFPVASSGFLNALGHTTEEAWSNGTLTLVVNTINQKIREIKNEIPDISVFLTGGGYSGLQNFLDFDHDYHKNIVIDGLQFYADYVG